MTRAVKQRHHLRVAFGDEPSSPLRLSDSEIIELFERGDGQGCEALYDRLIGAVEGTLFRILGGRDEAHDDLVQTAFEQIILSLSRHRFSQACSLDSWASSITANVAFNVIRSRSRERKVLDRRRDPENVRRSASVDVERDVSAREVLVHVRKRLAVMKERYVMTLVLHDVMGHELSEIASLTGVSVAAAQSRLVRGRKELWRLLAKDGLRLKDDES